MRNLDPSLRVDGVDAAGGSGGKRRVASMAYNEPPQTLRTARAAAPSPRRAWVEGRTQRADISSFDSEPPLSTSMSSKQCRAAFLNSFVNSSSSLAACRAIISCARRCAARAWSFAFSAFSIASSLRGERPVPRRVDGVGGRKQGHRVSTTRLRRSGRRDPYRARRAPAGAAPARGGT